MFSAKLYGSRSRKNKKVIEQANQLFKGDKNGEEKEGETKA
jgi:hypothetical protein